jgi:hypothetical protein
MKALILILFIAFGHLAYAGGGATGNNRDVLIAFSVFVMITAFSFAIPWLKRYLVKRFKLVRKH